MKPALLATLTCALALGITGCGDGSTSAASTLTAAEWRREANAICRDVGPRVRAVPLPKSLNAIEPFTSAVIPLWKLEEDGIRALAHPPELEAGAEGYADGLAELTVSLLETHIATQRGDGGRRADAIRRGEVAARGMRLRSRELGLDACAAQRIP